MEKDRSRNVYIYRPFYSFLSRYRIQDYSTNLFYETYTVNIYTGPGYISTYDESSSLFPPIYIIGGDHPTTVSLLLRLFCATGEERSDYTFSRSWGSTKKSTQKTRILARRMNRVTVKNDPSTRSSLSRGTTSVFTLCLVSSSPPVAHLSLIFPRIKSRTRECNAAILYSLLFLEGIHVVSPFSSIFRRLSFFLSSLLNHPMIVERESGK